MKCIELLTLFQLDKFLNNYDVELIGVKIECDIEMDSIEFIGVKIECDIKLDNNADEMRKS